MLLALKYRNPLPFQTQGKESFGLDRVRHHHPRPAGVQHHRSEKLGVPGFVCDPRGLVEECGSFPVSSFHRKAAREQSTE